MEIVVAEFVGVALAVWYWWEASEVAGHYSEAVVGILNPPPVLGSF